VAGSFLEGAPIVPVSSVTGTGLDELRRALARVAAQAPEKDPSGHFRLPIDRVFTVKGFGTVATGTLVSGSVARGREVELYPAGRRLRVRGVQVHGAAADRAVAGQRTAVNLADIEPAGLARGHVLSEPGVFRAVKQVDCRLQLLPTAKPLKHRAPVHFHSGTAEIEAQVRLLEGTAPLQPGGAAYVRLLLRDPALLLPGDRFIIRMFSPVVTIGGGVVLDVGTTGKAAPARLDVLASADAAERIALLVRETPFGMGMADLVARTGLVEPEIAAARARAPLMTIPQPQPWYVDRAWFQAARCRMVETVREFHRRNPLQPGIAKLDLRPAGAPPFVLDALLTDAATEIVAAGETVRLRGHTVVLNVDEQQARASIELAFQQAGLAAPTVAQVLAKSGVEPARARSLLQILLREKRLLRINDDLVVHHSAILELRRMLEQRKPAPFSVGAFKEWTGVSRKYAIPLLEFLDRERITRRQGEERFVL
jgi:selenocysteine-specific elongation factor